jgi:predicted Zn-dependent peptidase
MNRNKLLQKNFQRTAYLVAFLVFINPVVIQSQQEKLALHTEIYTLENGLTVYLNEDRSLPNIFGAVAVKGGSKRDPSDATGIAHYFEHIMFKGTDQIGTLNYQTEKTYLDSIADLYDQLSSASVEEEQLMLQKEINRLSIKASEFAIPNEIEKILGEMGCAYLNAGTGYDGIVYFNVLPANQIEKWLEIYSHRFINPVYRLFQSELETVYEEYNMYSDDRFSTAFEAFSAAFYPEHPYGVPILGYPHHLKHPSLEKMHEYFETYYVANNMALVLSGNFDAELIKPMIVELFGRWRSGEIPNMPDTIRIKPLEGRQLVSKRLTPIKFGIKGYRSVPAGNPDIPVLDVINMLLSNPSQTGLLDEMTVDNQLIAAQVFSDRRVEAGGEYIFFVPKVLGQSLKKGEQLIDEKLMKLKAGDFDEELMEAVKTEIMVSYQKNFEDQYSRGYKMIMAFTSEKEWESVLNYPERISNVSKNEVIEAANIYLTEGHLAFHSKTGLPKKPKTLKPPFESIPSGNSDRKSEYAKMIEEMSVQDMMAEFIRFGEQDSIEQHVTIDHFSELLHFYYVENPVNDLFELKVRYGVGIYEMPVLSQVAEYMGLVGPADMPFNVFKRKLQTLGASLFMNATKNYFEINISGPEQNLSRILGITGELLESPLVDDEKIKNLYQTAKTNEKYIKKDPEILGHALYSYAIYGKNSQYLKDLTSKEVKKLTAAELVEALRLVLRYQADIHYSGALEMDLAVELIKTTLPIWEISIAGSSPVKNVFPVIDEPLVYFLNEKSAIQSKDYFFIRGNTLKEMEKPLLNAYYEYMDGGMSGIIFQEIREFRSLAYATGASVFMPFYRDEETGLVSYVGTQADKTREAIEVMQKIISSPPDKSDRIDMIKKSLIQSINSKKPTFRDLSEPVASWVKQNYSADPRMDWVRLYNALTFDDIVGFYNNQFHNKPVITTIIGNKKQIGADWMGNHGKLIEVRKKELFRK